MENERKIRITITEEKTRSRTTHKLTAGKNQVAALNFVLATQPEKLIELAENIIKK